MLMLDAPLAGSADASSSASTVPPSEPSLGGVAQSVRILHSACGEGSGPVVLVHYVLVDAAGATVSGAAEVEIFESGKNDGYDYSTIYSHTLTGRRLPEEFVGEIEDAAEVAWGVWHYDGESGINQHNRDLASKHLAWSETEAA